MLRKSVILILLIQLLASCNLFTTRNPEEPDTGKSSYLPPSDPSIVIENLKNSIIEKNASNYASCFSDSSVTNKYTYIFEATGELKAIYASLFTSWNKQSEKTYFNSMINSLKSGTYPELHFTGGKFIVTLPDSHLYLTDYYLKIDHDINTFPKEFSGTMQLTITPAADGLWYIHRWIDKRRDNDTIKSTWSLLKAQFNN